MISATEDSLARTGKPREGCEGFRRPASRFPGRSGRRRAIALGAVHLLIGLHLLHWVVTGTTLSPVEPSESMYTLENGQVNAGFIFFIVAILSTALLGRWFCGWACHMVALQDLCGWMMRKIGIRPQPFRSRLLGWVPFLLAFYMFLWPTLKRWSLPWFEGQFATVASWIDPVRPWVGFTDHLMVADFWATFPSWWIAIPFFLVCGFATVYLLGSKGFCSYGCPYGAFFSLADRISPMAIVANMDACESCGLCTANCSSNVQISREIKIHSQVVDPGCMKCLDCVDVCPNGVLSFGKGAWNPLAKAIAPTRNTHLSLQGEVSLAILCALIWFSWRGVYDQIPMLMATGIAISLSFLIWKSSQILRLKDVSLHGQRLRGGGVFTIRGGILLGITVSLTLLTLSAAHTRWNEFQANRHFNEAQVNLDQVLIPGQPPISPQLMESAALAVQHLQRCRHFSRGGFALLEPPGTILEEKLGYMSAVSGDLIGASSWWGLALEEKSSDDLLVRYGQLVELQEGPQALARWLDSQRERLGNRLTLVNLRGDLARRQALSAFQGGQAEAAARHLQALIGWIGEEPELLRNIADLLDQAGVSEEATSFRQRAQLSEQNSPPPADATDRR